MGSNEPLDSNDLVEDILDTLPDPDLIADLINSSESKNSARAAKSLEDDPPDPGVEAVEGIMYSLSLIHI